MSASTAADPAGGSRHRRPQDRRDPHHGAGESRRHWPFVAAHRYRLLRPHARADRAAWIRLDIEAEATCMSTATTRWRMWDHSGQAVRGRGRQARHRAFGHAYVPLDEALSRVVIDFSGPDRDCTCTPFKSGMIGGFDTQLAHEFFQGLRQPRAGDPACRQPARRERPPSGRDGVQGLCRALRLRRWTRIRARPARFRRRRAA